MRLLFVLFAIAVVNGASNTMYLNLLKDNNYCNDGSPAGFELIISQQRYWIRKGTDPSRWVIYLQGENISPPSHKAVDFALIQKPARTDGTEAQI